MIYTQTYSIDIHKPVERVWQVLWSDQTYRKWTAVFMDGSYAESSWGEGDNILFLTPDKSGMYSIIEKKRENEIMVFRHLGEIKDGVEIPKNWKHATEAYQLSDQDGITVLKVVLTMDETNAQFEAYFNATFPKALALIKSISEEQQLFI